MQKMIAWCSKAGRGVNGWSQEAGSLKMNTALEYSTRVVQEGGRRCKKSTLNDLVHLTPLRIPLMNPQKEDTGVLSRFIFRCSRTEAGFMDVIRSKISKILRFFYHAIHSYPTRGFYSPPLVFISIAWNWDLVRRKTKQKSRKKTQVCSWIALRRKPKPKVETSSLRNLKIMPRNPSKIVFSWISPQNFTVHFLIYFL